MLTVQACSGNMAGSYFVDAEDNYYTRDQSSADEWNGKLCDKLGLKDGATVKAEDFQVILSARDSKCAGYDLTFSAPKSVSILSQIGTDQARKDMTEAHREAVTATIKEIEQHEIYTRARINGQIMQIKTGEMAAAKFEHNLSRNLDPQLHTHAFISNMTEYNGQLYAVDGSRLYQVQKIYGAEYRARLALNLRARGYDISVTDPDKGFFELVGMNQNDMEIFSTRRAEILADMEARGVSGAAEAQLSTLGTRQTKEKDIDQERLREKWRDTWGDRQLAEKSAEPLPEHDREALQRKAYVEAVEALEEKKYAWTAKDFEQEITARGVACGMTRERAKELIAEDLTILRGNFKKACGKEEMYFTSIKNYEQEKGLYKSVAEGRSNFTAALDHETVENTRMEVCLENGWKLTEEQENLVSHISESRDNVIAVRGLAGVGKSFSLNVAREVLERNGYEVMGAAPSGQAAKELAEDAGMEGQMADGATRCGTLQRIMNEAERRAGNSIQGENYEKKREWIFDNIKAPIKPKVYLIDEAGMVDNNSMSEFFKLAESERAAGGDVKIVLVGDDRQLLPVGTGNFFGDAIQREVIATTELTNIRRQQGNHELLVAVREAVDGSLEKSIDILTKGGDIHEIKTTKGRVSAIVREYMSLTDAEMEETIILSAQNADRKRINEAIRAQLVQAGKVGQGNEYTVETTKVGKIEVRNFAAGDKIVFLKNDIKAGVRNGTQGTIEKIEGNHFNVRIAKDKTVSIDINKYKRIDHAYAVTTHKAQGATVKRAIINMSSRDKGLNSRNAYYVDISRAKSKVSLYCDSKSKIGAQVKDFATKLTAKDFNFSKPAGGAIDRTTTKAMPTTKVIKSVAALVPPIPVVNPVLDAEAKIAVRDAKLITKKL